MISSFAVPVATLLALAEVAPHSDHHHPQLGKVSFETSCNDRAQSRVEEGFAWLHSFEYEQAASVFSDAAAADESCAIAYWGLAASYYHPLWAPPNREELAKANAALAKAKAATSKDPREQDYIAALDTFYRDADQRDHKSRATDYSSALQKLHQRYPADREAAVFYALSLIAAGTMDADPNFSKEKEAAAILNRILKEEPDHPGVAHYLIHSFDYPQLAELALPAARRYAGIAPASPHAQHMPSHIFVRLGLWDEAILSNLASEAAARDMAKAQGLADSSSERLHAMDYLAYGYLQTGQDDAAQQVLSNLYAIKQADPPIFSVAYAATAIPARILLERRMWKEAASLALPENISGLTPPDQFKWAQAHIHFARAVGSAKSGNAIQARDEVAKLLTIEQSIHVPAGTYDWRTQVSIQRRIAEAWLAHAEKRPEAALDQMKSVADLDDATEKHPVTPGALLPAREQLAELMLELGQPKAALEQYELSLRRAPRRFAAIYGAARAAKQSGDPVKARAYYRQLIDLTSKGDGNRPEVKEAMSALAAAD